MHVLRHEQSQHAVAGDSCGCWNNKAETLKKACFRGYPKSTICVQVPVGSRNSAIHNAYRTSLRPSSLIEPRHPSLKVVKSSRQEAVRQDMKTNSNAKRPWQQERAGRRPSSFPPPSSISMKHRQGSSHRHSQRNSHEFVWNMCE